jgi:SOS-response transcriptional repressor LexA
MPVYLTDRPVLTRRQRRMLDYITNFREQHGYCVTVREIMAEFGIRVLSACPQRCFCTRDCKTHGMHS